MSTGTQPGGKRSFWGGPGATDLHESVTGQLDEETWPLVLDALREVTGRVGAATQNGRAYEWTSTSPDVLHVSVTPAGGRVRLRVLGRCGEWGGLIYMGFFLLALILSAGTTGSTHPPLPVGLVMTAGWFTGGWLAGRTMFNRLCEGRRRHAGEVMRRLKECISRLPGAD